MTNLSIYNNIPRCITFHMCCNGSDSSNWMMKLTEGKIEFNSKDFPDMTMDDFAKGIIDILENSYNVKFTKKEGK